MAAGTLWWVKPMHPKQGWATPGCGDTRDTKDQA